MGSPASFWFIGQETALPTPSTPATGEDLAALLSFVDEMNWQSEIDLHTGLPVVNPDKVTHIGKWATIFVRWAVGRRKGLGTGAYSPDTGLFYCQHSINACPCTWLKAEYRRRAPYMATI